MSSKTTILACGYVALDVIRANDGTWLRAGGTAANVAALTAYFGWAASVVGRLGDDDAGPLVKRDLGDSGVDTRGLALSRESGTPLVLHDVRTAGSSFRFGCAACGRNYRPHRPPRIDEVLVEDEDLADVFFFDRASKAALVLAERHRQAGKHVVYEPGSQGRVDAHRAAVALADLVKFSEERRGLFADALTSPLPGQVWIETRGPRGARVSSALAAFELPGHEIAAVDPVGAGDWFTAGLLTRLGRGVWGMASLKGAARYASALAALACLVPGARSLSEIAEPTELDKLVNLLLGQRLPTLRQPEFAAAGRAGHCPQCHLPLPDRTLAVAG